MKDNKNDSTRTLLMVIIGVLLLITLYIIYNLGVAWMRGSYSNDSNIETFAGQSGFKWAVTRSKDDNNKFVLIDTTSPSGSIPYLISTSNPNGTQYIRPSDANISINIGDDTATLKLVNEVVSLNSSGNPGEYLRFLAPGSTDYTNYKFLEMSTVGSGFSLAMLVKFADASRALGTGKYESVIEIYTPDTPTQPTTDLIIARNGSDFDTATNNSLNNKLVIGFVGNGITNNTGLVNSTKAITDTNWHHIVVTVNFISQNANNSTNSYKIILYIDGKLDSQNTITIPTKKLVINESTQFNIGKNTIASQNIFTKLAFADMQLYPSTLSANDVKAMILQSRFTQTRYIAGSTPIINGNLVKFSTNPELKRPLPEAEDRNIIQLQFPTKLTGFKFTASAADTASLKYRLFIAESRQQVLNPRTRTEILIPEELGGFTFGQVYNSKPDFEKEDGTPKYTGAFLAIEMLGDNSAWPQIGEYQIFGLMLNAPSISEYEKYIGLSPITQSYSKSAAGQGPNDMIKLMMGSDADQMVGKIIITNFTADNRYSPQCHVRYRNSMDSAKTSLVAVNGPIRDQFINTPGTTTWVLYLDRAAMANYLELTFTKADNTPLDVNQANVTLFGFTPTTRDIANYKLQAGQTSSDARINLRGTSCPATSEMLNKQVQAQLICEALEYKDKEKNKRLAYERDKLYLQKLKAQESEIRQLEQKITRLISRKNELASKSEGSSIDELEKELKAAEAARKQAEEYMTAKDAARESIRLKVNLDPQFQALLGPDTATTPTNS